MEGNLHFEAACLTFRAAQPGAGLLQGNVPAKDVSQRARVYLPSVPAFTARNTDDVRP